MKVTKQFSTEEIEEQLDDATVVSRTDWRHGHKNLVVAEIDGAHWRFEILVHHSEGWELGETIVGTKVEPKQVMRTEWVPVKADDEEEKKR